METGENPAGSERKFHYCVLFTQTLKQWEVTEVLRKSLPEGRGTVFYPCVELWMGSLGRTVTQALFPGYVFVRSDMELAELHDIIRRRRRDLLSFVKELHICEKRQEGEEWDEDILIDLKDNEAEFLDFMLNFRQEGQQGVLGMSKGYREGSRYVVMEGPLKGYEDYIADVNPKDRRAYLKLTVGGQRVRAGLEIKGKRYYFPEDEKAPDLLADGTEVDCGALARMMSGFHGK